MDRLYDFLAVCQGISLKKKFMMVIQKSEFNQIHTTDQPRTLRKIYRSRTATRQQENSESEVSSSLFFSEMQVKLKRTIHTRTIHEKTHKHTK